MGAKKSHPGKLLSIGRKSIQEYRRGHVYYIRWWCEYELEDGKVVQQWSPSRTVHGKKALAESEAEKYRQELQGLIGKPSNDVPFLRWIDMFQKSRIEESCCEDGSIQPLTIERDENYLRRIRKYFGHVPYTEVTPRFIVDVYDEMRKNGESAHTIYRCHVKLKQIFDYLIFDISQNDNTALMLNPCDLKLVKAKAKQPKSEKKDSLTQEEAAALARSILQEDLTGYKVAVFLALVIGLRRGECLGLIWDDVDFDGMVIHIRKQYGKERKRKKLKTEDSESAIPIEIGVVVFLRFWKKKQAEYFASKGVEQTAHSPICNNYVCDFAAPHLFNRWRRNYFVEHGLGYFENNEEYIDNSGHKRHRRSGYVGKNLHTLRHTQSTLLIGNETDLKTVQGRLRHATSSVTLDVYAHQITENDRKAAELIEELLGLTDVESGIFDELYKDWVMFQKVCSLEDGHPSSA